MKRLIAASRASVVLVLLTLLALVGVRIALLVAPLEREAWALIGVSVDRSILYARLSTSSTGFYDHQVTTRLAALPTQSFAVEHRAMLGPAEGTVNGIAAGSDDLTWAAGVWHLHVGGDNVQVRAMLHAEDVPESPEAPGGCPPTAGSLAGVLGVGDGGDSSGALVLDGKAVVVHTLARGVVRNRALYVLGPDFAAGIDPLADCPAWVRAGAASWSGDAPTVPEPDGGEVRLGDWMLTVHREDDALRMETFGHLLGFERWAAAIVGWPEPIQILQRTTVTVHGPGVSGPRPGLVLERTTN